MSHSNPHPPFNPQPGQPHGPNPYLHPSAQAPGGQIPGGQVPGGWHSAPAAPQPPRRGRSWLTYGATALVALLVGVGIGSSGDAKTENTSALPQPTVTVTAKAKPAPTVTVTETIAAEVRQTTQEPETTGPATTMAGDGQYLVGEDIKPGTYKTAGTASVVSCYWARLKNASGELSAIIANDNITGPTRVTLNKGEYFETKRCQPWKRVG